MIPLADTHQNSWDIKNLTSFWSFLSPYVRPIKFPFGDRNKFKFCLFMNPITKCFTAANESFAARVMEYSEQFTGFNFYFHFFVFRHHSSVCYIFHYLFSFFVQAQSRYGNSKNSFVFFSWKYVADITFDRFSEIELISSTSVGVKSINDSTKQIVSDVGWLDLKFIFEAWVRSTIGIKRTSCFKFNIDQRIINWYPMSLDYTQRETRCRLKSLVFLGTITR